VINSDEFFAQIKDGAARRLILASTSAARQAMLRQAGLDFSAIPSGVDEAALKQGFAGTPEELALALAAAKARAVGAAHPGALVLGAEGEEILGCVGAYRLEGLGAQLFSRVEGDHFTILGLSLLPLLGFLRGAGALAA